MKLFNLDCWIAYKTSSHLMSLQAITGIGFDKEAAVALLAQVNREMEELGQEVEPLLPPCEMVKGDINFYRFPAKPWNKDGTYSTNMVKWCETRGANLLPDGRVEIQSQTLKIVAGQTSITQGPMLLKDHKKIKEWLMREGWVPTIWNYKKDKNNKTVRDEDGEPIVTSPKFADDNGMCPNLNEIGGDIPKKVVRWYSLRNRRGVISGWLSNPRLEYDGRLPASAPLITKTFRQKHSVVCNVPKADGKSVLGVEMRSLFKAQRPGYKFVGYDASALEARIEGHYVSRYDGGREYAEELINGDIHLKTTAVVFRSKVEHLLGTDNFHKEHPEVKPWRSKSKNVKYGITYGAQPKRVAVILGSSLQEGRDVFNAFWETAPPLRLFLDKLTSYWTETGKKKYVLGIDGRKIKTRYKHSLGNDVFQSCGAIVMDYSTLFMDKWLGGIQLDSDGYPCYHYKGHRIYRVSYHHDELGWEVPEELAKGFAELGERSIVKAGEHLKLRVPLAAEGKVGDNWKDVH